MLNLREIFDQIVVYDYTPLLLALVLGGLIGLERELHGRPAGLRTHMLVCLCSTVLVSASRQLVGFETLPGTNVVFDPQRLSAGIVTGIGFLGAAAVVRSGDMVRGLTTGASVWCVAGLGVVIGQGAYGAAVMLTAASMFVLVVLNLLPGRFGTLVYRRLKVAGITSDVPAVAENVRAVLKKHRMRVQEISGELSAEAGEGFELSFHIRCRDTMQAPRILEEVGAIEGVAGVHWTSPRR